MTENEKRNMETCRRVLTRVWGAGELDICDEVFLPDFVRHDASSGDATGPGEYKALVETIRIAFPDLRIHIDRLTPAGNTVFFRTRMEGRHTGSFYGLPGTGARIHASTQAEVVFREDGWCVEAWVISDYLSVTKSIVSEMSLLDKLRNAPTLLRMLKE